MRIPVQGELFTVNSRLYEIVFANHDSVRYSCTQSNNLRSESFHDFLIFLKSGKSEHPFKQAPTVLLSTLSKQDREEVLQRYQLIEHVEANTLKVGSKRIVEPLLQKFNTNKDKVIPFSTFHRIYKKYTDSGRNLSSLVSKKSNRGRRKQVLDEDIEDLVEDAITTIYLAPKKRYTATQAYGYLEAEYHKQFGSVSPELRPKLISYRTFTRRIRDLDQYRVTEIRYSKARADRLFRCKGSTEHIYRPLERVEADGNYLDLIIIDPLTGDPIGRPRLTVFFDVFSRCILSFELSIGGFSAASLLRAFKAALTPDNGLPYGRFEKLYLDNGSDYISHSFQNACSQLKIQVDHLSPRTPNGKAYVERFFRTMNTQLIHTLDGTTYSNPEQRGDNYNPEKKARFTLDEVKQQIDAYIKESYHLSPNRTTRRAPITLWDEHAQLDPVCNVSPEDVDLYCRITKKGVISNSRVSHLGLHFTSASLAEIERRHKRYRRDSAKFSKQKVEFYIDESDLSYVLVKPLDIPNSPLIKAISTQPEKTENLSLFEYKLIRKAMLDSEQKDKDLFKGNRLAWARQTLHYQLANSTSKHARKTIAQLGQSRPPLVNLISHFNEEPVELEDESAEVSEPSSHNDYALGEDIGEIDSFEDFSLMEDNYE